MGAGQRQAQEGIFQLLPRAASGALGRFLLISEQPLVDFLDRLPRPFQNLPRRGQLLGGCQERVVAQGIGRLQELLDRGDIEQSVDLEEWARRWRAPMTLPGRLGAPLEERPDRRLVFRGTAADGYGIEMEPSADLFGELPDLMAMMPGDLPALPRHEPRFRNLQHPKRLHVEPELDQRQALVVVGLVRNRPHAVLAH